MTCFHELIMKQPKSCLVFQKRIMTNGFVWADAKVGTLRKNEMSQIQQLIVLIR